MDKNSVGCCNMVLWDFLIIMLASIALLPDTLHIVLRVIIGVSGAVLITFLFQIPFLGWLLNVAVGLFWAYVLWEIFNLGDWEIVKDNTAWTWVFKIAIGAGCIMAHSASVGAFGTRANRQTKSANYRYQRKQNSQRTDYSGNTGTGHEKSNRREPVNPEGFNPFAGCDTKESLAKRYRNLCKNFHPDEENGDTEQMKVLNALYQERLKEMEQL